MKNNFLPLVLNGEVTGFNTIGREIVFNGQPVVSYGHAEPFHLQLLLEELKEKRLLVRHLIGQRDSTYLWSDEWEPSSNTRITTAGSKKIAVEAGYLVQFFPKNGMAKPLIDFLVKRCVNNGNGCIKGSWVTPFITSNFYHREFIATKEFAINQNGQVLSCFAPDKLRLKSADNKRIVYLIRQFADFVKN